MSRCAICGGPEHGARACDRTLMMKVIEKLRRDNAALLAAAKRLLAFDGRYGAPEGNIGEEMDLADLSFNIANIQEQAHDAIAQAEGKS